MSDTTHASTGSAPVVDRSEGFGERLLGTMIERAHEMPPHLIAPLVAEVIAAIGGRDVAVFLQDYEQVMLVPLTGRGLVVQEPESIDDSAAGRAFLGDAMVEEQVGASTRLFAPLLDGTDRIGVLAFTADDPDPDDRRLARRFAGLLADILVTKGMYTDRFFQTRRRHPMSLSAEMQWALLPPLTMTTPQVAVAGVLEPVYDVAGDSFDYALNDEILQLSIIDAMGHGIEAAVMATVAVAAYRHARRRHVELSDIYAGMDRAIAEQFDEDRYVTAQMARLDVGSGTLQWVNAGHPAPLLLRDHRVVRSLSGSTTLPVGVGGATPTVNEDSLERGDRVLFYTDGITEGRVADGEQLGEDRLIEHLERADQAGEAVQQTVRRLSHDLTRQRGGEPGDDATLFLVEWTGGTADHLTTFSVG